MSLTIGIDLGSSGVKVAALDVARGIVAEATAPNDIYAEHPGWAEADPEQWWRNVIRCVNTVLGQAACPPDGVAAVAVSGMVPAVLFLDATGRPVYRALLQNDARAFEEVAALRGSLGHLDLLAATGSELTQQSVAPSLVWFARHQPGLWARVRSVVGSYDWIAAQLGADAHVERNWAVESGLFHLDGAPFEEVFSAAGAEPSIVPPIRDPGQPVGSVSAKVADSTGLRAGTPIIVGGADHVLSAFAAGLHRPGETLIKLGGAGDILVVADTPLADRRLYLDRHPDPALWLPNGCMATSGTLLRWFQREIARDVPIERLDDEAEAAAPGANGLVCLPYFLGEKSPLHDPNLRGAFLGLHLGTTRGELFRACLEAVAYGFRHHLDVYAELGIAPESARVTNGGSKSRLWKQVVADVCGITLEPVLDHPGASLGAAVVAAIGVRELAGWGDAGGYARLAAPIVPRADLSDRYADAYAVFCRATDTIAPLSHQLARANHDTT
ncbi:MAG: FGGY family carbohydrate kinase [Actinomycetia bacterium]|nr:FGGY family carbohydrate kinase [Actinomycetes bacterium]